MANNRLYLVDTETWEYVLLAKGWGSGWQYWDDCPLDAFLAQSESEGIRDHLAAMGDGPTKFRIYTEQDLPKECGRNSWKPVNISPEAPE